MRRIFLLAILGAIALLTLTTASAGMRSASTSDTTPPLVSYDVSGTTGNVGWYTSDVSVTWTVTDPDSVITSMEGCTDTTISADTDGTTLTCVATSEGGSSEPQSVTVKRDATPPSIDGSALPAANAHGWRNSDVTVSFGCADGMSGLGSCNPDVTIATEGSDQSVTRMAIDNAGNVATTTVSGISIDKTPPLVEITGVENAATYTLGSVPTAGCGTSDVLSGVASEAGVSLIGGPIGHVQVACAGATDKAGNTGFGTIGYTVVDATHTADGVVAWGYNEYGQATVPDAATSGVVAIAAGGHHSLALKADGSVIAWGNNDYGQASVPAEAASGVVAIAAGGRHSLALKADGSVIGWGWNAWGQTDVPAEAGSGVVAIAAGSAQSLALKADGSVIAWGSNWSGEASVPSEAASGVVAIAAGSAYSLALKADGSVIAWGNNDYGQASVPGEAASGVVAIAACWEHGLALKADGSVVAWGSNWSGEASVPTLLTDATAIAAGDYHSLAIGVKLSDTTPPEITPVVNGILGADGWYRSDVTLSWDVRDPESPVTSQDRCWYDVVWWDTDPSGVTFTCSATSEGGTSTRSVTIKRDTVAPDVMLTGVVDGAVYTSDAVPTAGCTTHDVLSGVQTDATVTTTGGPYGPVQLTCSGGTDKAGNVAPDVTANYTVLRPPVVAWGCSRAEHNFGQCDVPGGLRAVTAVSAGGSHSLALKRDGTIVAWGSNELGQTSVPDGLTNVTAIAAGGAHSLALERDGTVVAWGSNEFGQTSVPIDLTDVTAIAAGRSHSLALKADGTVVAWGCEGASDHGQCAVPTDLTNVKAIAAGGAHSLALKTDGTVVAWGCGGDSDHGQCTVPAGLIDVAAIAAGGAHSAALRTVGTVAVWGDNSYGQLNVPPQASGIRGIATGAVSSLAILRAGQNDAIGAIGCGDPMNDGQCSPVPAGLSDVMAIAAGDFHSLALVAVPDATPPEITPVVDGQVGTDGWYRGDVNVSWTLTDPDSDITASSGCEPTTIGTDTEAAGITLVCSATSAGGSTDRQLTVKRDSVPPTTAVTGVEDGATYTLGAVPTAGCATSDALSGLGTEATAARRGGRIGSVLVTCSGGTDKAGNVAADATAAYTIVSGTPSGSSQVVAWGSNAYGQLNAPAGLTGVTAIAAGGAHSLALKDDGTVVAWGSDAYGQTTVPAGLTDAIAVSAGGNHSLALRSGGHVVAWGSDEFGQTNVPPDLTNVTAIAAGGTHSLALKSDGTVVAWGDDTYGQTDVPAGLSNVKAIAAGGYHSLALKTDGTVVAWGCGTAEQGHNLGQCTVPAGLTNVAAIGAGGHHSVALKTDTTPAAWGDNSVGQIDIPPETIGLMVISAGGSHNLGLMDFGGLGGSGANTDGQLDVPNGLQNAGVLAIAAGGAHSLALLPGPDKTPPVITPEVWGNQGDEGWYRNDVSVSWHVEDPESPVTSTVGCDSMWVRQDTDRSGITLTCTATSEGGTTSQQVTIKRDTTPPVVTISGVEDGASYPLSSIPTAVCTTSDELSGVAQNANAWTSGGPFGLVTARCSSARDKAGNWAQVGVTYTVTYAPVVALGCGTSGHNFGQCAVPPDLAGVAAISAARAHSLALERDGTVRAWGCGGGQDFGQCDVPLDVSDAAAVSAGASHSLALKADGTVKAWGCGGGQNFGQCDVPQELRGVNAISAGTSHSLALKADGTVAAWGCGGDHDYGQCNVPAGLRDVTAIAAGGYHSLALKADGTVVAWGCGGGHDLGQCTVPLGLSGVTGISAGRAHSVAVKADTTPAAWGDNTFGQISIPSQSVGIAALAAGGDDSLGLMSFGGLGGIGDNADGQLNVPNALQNAGVMAIAAGGYHSLALVAEPGADNSPPAITPGVQGTVGDGGWYTSEVTVTWNVSDAQSVVTSTDGCADTTIAGTVAGGTTLTCSARSAGGVSTRSMTIRIDDAAPDSLATSPEYNNDGTIAVTYTHSDGLSGVKRVDLYVEGPGESDYSLASSDVAGDPANPIDGSFDYAVPSSDGKYVQGAYRFYTLATDLAGNVESSPADPDSTTTQASVKPLLSVSHAANGAGWNNTTSVTLAVSSSDADWGLAPGSPSCTEGSTELTLTPGVDPGTWTTTVSGEGTHVVDCQSTNNAGSQQTASDTVLIDTTAPTISDQGPTTPANAAGWYDRDVTNVFEASDAFSGLDTACATAFPLVAGQYLQSKTTSGEGTAVKVGSDGCTDLAGNTAVAIESVGFQIDKTKPVISDQGATSSPNGAGWYSDDVTNVFEASDGLSGLDASCVAAFPLDAGRYLQSKTSSGEGLAVRATSDSCTDAAGNTAAGMDSIDFHIDKTAPAITDQGPTTSANGAGWYSDDVTNVFEASDALSGLDAACVTAFPPAAGRYLYAKTTSGEGAALTVRSDSCTDVAGNTAAAVTSAGFRIDKTSPTIADLGPTTAANEAGWYNHDVANQFEASDALSGLDPTCLSNFPLLSGHNRQSQTTTGEGTALHVSSDSCADLAGNTAVAITSADFKIDETAPTITDHGPTMPANAAGWYDHDVTNVFEASDSLSGPDAACLTTFPLDAGRYLQAKTTAGEGTTVKVSSDSCTDLAGNTAPSAESAGFKIDETAPAITDLGPMTSPNAAGWYNGDLANRFEASDSLSGLDSACVASFPLDSGHYVQSTSTSGEGTAVMVSSDGCTDVAGNAAPPKTSGSFRIDKSPPTVEISGITDDATYIYGQVPEARCETNDPLSGVEQVASPSLVGGPIGPVTVTCSGGTDNAGNAAAEVEATYTVVVDDAPPVSAATSPQHSSSNTFTISYTASDASPSSGFAEVELYVKRPGDSSFGLALTDTPGGTGGTFSYTADAGDGGYSFYTVAHDLVGNIETAPASPDASTVVDTQVPTSATTSPQYSTSRTFFVTYTTSDAEPSSGLAAVELYVKRPGDSSFRLAATTSSDTPYFVYTATVDGEHGFYTRAHDEAGNVEGASADAQTTTFVDTRRPASSATSAQYSASSTFTISYTADDATPSSDLWWVDLYVKRPGDASFRLVQASVSGSFSYTADAGDGTYSFYTRAHDMAGNYELAPPAADASTFVETQSPASTATSPASSRSSTFTVSYTASDVSPSAGLNRVQLYVKRPGDSAFSLALTDTPGGTSGSFTYTADAGDGTYGFYTRAYDNAGNAEAAPPEPDATTLVGSLAPTSQATASPYSVSKTLTVGYTASVASGSSSQIADVELWAKAPGGSFTKVATDAGEAIDGSFTFVAGVDGTHEFYVRAHDLAGYYEDAPGSADASTSVDTLAPISDATSPPWSTSQTVTIGYSASDPTQDGYASGPADVELWAKGPADVGYSLVATEAGEAIDGSFAFTAEVEGSYEFYVRAHDLAGNYEDAPASPDGSISVDTQKPSSQTSSPQYSTSSTITVGYTAADPFGAATSGLEKVELYVQRPGDTGYLLADTDTTPASTQAFSFTATADGTHSFFTVAYDKAGNVEAKSTADSTTLVDTMQPGSQASSPVSSTESTISVDYTAADPLRDNSASGLEKVELYVRAPGDGGYALADTDSTPDSTQQFQFTAGANGSYSFYTLAYDTAGNVEPAAAPDSPDAVTTFAVVDARISIAQDGTNRVNETHMLTAHVEMTDASGVFVDAPDGTAVSFTIESGPGGFGSANPCVTYGGAGACEVEILSTTTGVTTVSAETTFALGGVVLTRSTDGTGSNTGPAVVRWVDASIAIAQDEDTVAGQPHTFTVTLDKDTGDGDGLVAAFGEHVDVTLTAAGGATPVVDAAASTCDDAGANTDFDGRCTLTFTSATTGTVTAHAAAVLTVADGTLTVQTDGSGLNSPDAVKTVTATAPAITSPAAATAVAATPFAFTITAAGAPAPEITATGIPAGFTLEDNHDGTASLSGMSTLVGTYTLGIAATNEADSAHQTFVLTVGTAPVITTAASATAKVGTAFTFQVGTIGYPAPTFSESGALPEGITFTAGQFSGTPTPGSGGTYPLTITAANAAGSVDQTFVLTVNEVPAITSAASATAKVGDAFEFQATARGYPAPTFTEAGALPAGITFSAGTLSGTPQADSGGVYTLTITAKNAVGQVQQTFVLTVNEAPAITSAASATTKVAAAFSFQVGANGYPAPTFTETGALPAGITFSAGKLSGKPAAGSGGSYTITITATNDIGTDDQTFVLNVNELPSFTSAASATTQVGAAFDFQVAAGGYPAPTFTRTGALPAGVTFDAGHFSGTPEIGSGGKYTVTITAKNALGNVQQSFALTVNEAPAITSAAGATAKAGKTFTFLVTARGYPTPTLTETGALPTGITFAGGTLSGTAQAAVVGTYPLTMTATNAFGTDQQNFVLTVATTPVFTSAAAATAQVGTAFDFQVAAGGYPAPTFTQTGALPAGVTFDAGRVSGTPEIGSGGKYTLTITATNEAGSVQQTFVLTVNEPPKITSAAIATASVGKAFTFQMTASGYPAPTFTKTGTLPSGVTFTTAGKLSGTPRAGTRGTYTLTISATSSSGTDQQTFVLTVT